MSFLQRSRDWFVPLQVQPSQNPGASLQGPRHLGRLAVLQGQSRAEISKQSKAVTQPSESFQSQNRLRTITFHFGADVQKRSPMNGTQTHSWGCCTFETRAQIRAQLDSKSEIVLFLRTQASWSTSSVNVTVLKSGSWLRSCSNYWNIFFTSIFFMKCMSRTISSELCGTSKGWRVIKIQKNCDCLYFLS